MSFTRKLRVVLSWAVLFAVLFNVALPTLAAMHTNADSVQFTEICTVSGIKRIALHDADEQKTNLIHDGHCQLCAVHVEASTSSVDSTALPFPARQRYVLQEQPVALPSEQLHRIRPPSQAPPFFS
ncbi:DUF2946 domain-containing protein [Oxalobacteraceae bacterium R-40]|uniref:DUF2946 domain-containing protein n=1 Tax=Keguizhuia sedimenti TaxID=3064264 RepID=A0ABU1BTM8_9BURK|nr:DUF2946 domain-containing protein [Oxalobacteraceae bacterium R-40]